jgi:hypothetical protein
LRSIRAVDSVQEIRDIMTTSSSSPSVENEESSNSVSEISSSVPAEDGEVADDSSLVKAGGSTSNVKKPVLNVKAAAKFLKGKKGKKSKKKVSKSSQMSLRFKQQKQQQQQVEKTKVVQQPIVVVPPSPSKRVEDVLPDLIPPRNGRQPSRRSTEAEKSAAIIEHVVEMDKHFCCFTCLNYFANFHQVKKSENFVQLCTYVLFYF